MESVCSAIEPERCEGKTCGTYTFDCNPDNPDCACVKIAEGVPSGSCIANRSCGDMQDCVSSSDCDPGEICAVETCCGVGKCAVDNDCAPGAQGTQIPMGEGPTLLGL